MTQALTETTTNKLTAHANVCVVGLGYIGLPTSAVLASRGHAVHGVEINAEARDVINSGRAHIVEPDLDMLVRAGIESGRLKAHAEPGKADVFMLCVPTPVGENNGANLDYVRDATLSICPFLEAGNLVILESTSPPGTTEMIAGLVLDNTEFGPGEIFFAHAPERVLPGRILEEVVQNDRIIGGIDDASTDVARGFFSTFVRGSLITCHCRTAEMAKLVENSSRDVQIAFANELSMICDDFGVEVREMIDIANRHPRVNILQPGCGVGGHCIAVDPWFLVHMAGDRAKLIRTAREVNSSKPSWVVRRIMTAGNRFREPIIACFGATYKQDIDDMRESPALEIIDTLRNTGAGKILVVEPNVDLGSDYEMATIEQAQQEADIFVFLVGHREFNKFTPVQLAEKIVIDVCGVTHKTAA
ncbi:MAG: UDP-N-acetyl-D-mannosaminuronic acid dehydrogenase [Planctomycetota bacterium]|jgi:UDP-N-acetyl-D-mannosaminuronic acid dehydrogenase